MKTTCRIAGVLIVFFVLSIAGIPVLSDVLVPEVQAFRGRGAAFAVGAAAGSASASSSAAASSAAVASAEAEAAAAQQQAAAAQQQAAAAQQQALAAQQQAALAQQQAAAGQKLPVGTVVPALPPGCVSTPVGGKNYQYCGGNFYQPTYQGSTLVYITAEPK